MYERYGALFALRNHGGDEAVSAIVDSLTGSSALLKHEVCVSVLAHSLSLCYVGLGLKNYLQSRYAHIIMYSFTSPKSK